MPSMTVPGPRFSLAQPAADTLPSDTDPQDIAAMIVASETELSSRFDDLEVAVMDLVDLLNAPPDPEEAQATHLPARLERSLAAVLATLGTAIEGLPEVGWQDALLERLDGLEARFGTPDLTPLRVELAGGFDRLSSQIGGLKSRTKAEGQAAIALRRALDSLVGRLDAGVARLEAADLPATETTLARLEAGLDALREKVEALPPPSVPTTETDAALRIETGRAFDRIAALIGSQSRRFDAEKQALTRFLSGVDTVFARLEAATSRIEMRAATIGRPPESPDLAHSPAIEARLTRIEESLARLEERREHGTAEALHDMAMVIAEMLARQERKAAEIHRKNA